MFSALIVSLLCALPALAGPLLPRALPTPFSAASARSALASLTVATDSNSPAYNRDLFKTWDIISGTCDARETVLKRDGTNVVTNSACASVSGTWVSVYDGLSFTVSSQLDIDHIVPLKEAWVSGARNWSPAQREAFANDVTRPQLIAVSASSNRSKGDRDPAQWMPPSASFACTYLRAWVQVKSFYGLTVDSAEKSFITSRLASC
ncbi:hypothetical protein ONZ45_g13294 [Pleurotus djamor]|nr:hypothetical protein ONZ45_g13294 [Pleurotus djamor]